MFKKGDLVKCIRPSLHLTEGTVYEVLGPGGELQKCVTLVHDNRGPAAGPQEWFANRFELVGHKDQPRTITSIVEGTIVKTIRVPAYFVDYSDGTTETVEKRS